MDTGDASTSKPNARLDITKQYDARVAATTQKVDPFRAKANEALKDVDNFVDEKMSGQWDAPLLTLRQLIAGATGEQDDDQELDHVFGLIGSNSSSCNDPSLPASHVSSRVAGGSAQIFNYLVIILNNLLSLDIFKKLCLRAKSLAVYLTWKEWIDFFQNFTCARCVCEVIPNSISKIYCQR